MTNTVQGSPLCKLNPKQPEFVLATSSYEKRVHMDHNLAHFYQFNAESGKMAVIPDACIDILFWKKDGKIKTIIAGSRLEKGDVQTDLNCEYFGVRFMPGTNPVGNVATLCDLMNHEEDFENMIVSHLDRELLLEDMYNAVTFDDRIRAFMKFYKRSHALLSDDNNILKNYLKDRLCHADGNLKLTDLSDSTGYSERYLNKKIHEDFGLNPKSLIRIIRFQKAISTLVAAIPDINCADAAIESGYYDQSHLNKDFKIFTGLTPANYVDHLLCHSYDKKLHIIS